MSTVLNVSRVLSRIFWNGFANLNTNATNSNFSNLALDPSLSSSSSSSSNRHYAANFSQTAYLNMVLLNAKPSSFLKAAITRAVKPRLITAVCGFPKYRASKTFIRGKYGDDAWFKSCSPKADVLGVADGVGGWRAHGIDPGEFPTSLMRTCERHVKVGLFSPENPLELLKKSYHEMYHSPKSILGSSTACVVILNRNNSTVYTSNIGDSGFIIVRKGHVILRSREQQHYFNTPFQLSLPPPVHRNSVLIDQPDDAQIANIRVRSGDVILLASDGVFDNLPERIIIHVMSKVQGLSSGIHIQMVANSIAWMSRCLSYDQSFLSPFSKSAFSNGIFRVGGKPDDITVLLATVVV